MVCSDLLGMLSDFSIPLGRPCRTFLCPAADHPCQRCSACWRLKLTLLTLCWISVPAVCLRHVRSDESNWEFYKCYGAGPSEEEECRSPLIATMQMLLRIQELAAIRQLPQSLGSLSTFRLFSAAQVVTPDPKVQPGQGPPRFYKSVGVRPASDQAGPCHATSETAVCCPLDAKLSCRKAGMSRSITKTSKRQQGIPCWSQPAPWLLPLQLSGSGRSAEWSRYVVKCVAHHSGPAYQTCLRSAGPENTSFYHATHVSGCDSH